MLLVSTQRSKLEPERYKIFEADNNTYIREEKKPFFRPIYILLSPNIPSIDQSIDKYITTFTGLIPKMH